MSSVGNVILNNGKANISKEKIVICLELFLQFSTVGLRERLKNFSLSGNLVESIFHYSSINLECYDYTHLQREMM